MKGRRITREPMKPSQLLVPLGIGAAMALGVLLLEGFPEKGTEEFWKKCCDAFTVPGILLTGAGLLSLVSGQGAFDGISFAVKKAFGQIRSEEKRAAMPKTYYDYVSAKQAKGTKKSRGTLYAGLAFLAVALVFLGIYLSRYPL